MKNGLGELEEDRGRGAEGMKLSYVHATTPQGDRKLCELQPCTNNIKNKNY